MGNDCPVCFVLQHLIHLICFTFEFYILGMLTVLFCLKSFICKLCLKFYLIGVFIFFFYSIINILSVPFYFLLNGTMWIYNVV